MMKFKWQILIALLAIAVIVVLLLSQQPVLQENFTIQPATGGIYSEALVGEPGRLNPLLDYYNPVDHDINRLLYSRLITFEDRGFPQGDLAESWGISRDGKVYNFSIRANALWHDGQPVTSQDVIFTLETLRHKSTPYPEDIKALWNQIEILALDERTLQFRLPQPFAPFLDYLSFGVLPKHILAATAAEDLIDAAFNLEPLGSGPYRFEQFTVDNGKVDSVVLTAFEDYYGGRPFIDQVVFRYYPDAPSAMAAYRQGDVLGIGNVSRDILPDALKQPGLNLYTGRLPLLTMLYLNLDDSELPYFQEAAFRRMLLRGLNRQWMIDRLMDGQAIIADGPIFPDTWAYFENIERIGYDSEQALEEIKNLGYTIPAEGGDVRSKDDSRLSFELVFAQDDPYPALAQVIQQDWAKLGIQVNLKPVSFEELLSTYLEPRSYQAALITLNLSRSPDPDPYPFWDQAQILDGQNYAQWNDRQASEFLERARVTLDTSERTKAYRNFQVRFTTEMPALPLFYPVYSYGVDEQVLNVRSGALLDPSDRLNNFPSWFLLAKRPAGGEVLFTPTP